jgi:hypothetical protein
MMSGKGGYTATVTLGKGENPDEKSLQVTIWKEGKVVQTLNQSAIGPAMTSDFVDYTTPTK